MSYTSEELTNGFYQDNNSYEEIGELHANSKQAVVGRIDSRYNTTKKISLQAPDSDRLIYNFSSDSKVNDMAIRHSYDNLTEKMMFVGKDFIAVYDSEIGNFVLKEPHEFLKTLINSFDAKIDAGLGGLIDENATTLTYEQLDFICKSLKYVIAANKYFFIISELNNGHSVIWKIDPDTLRISKFRPKDFYDGPGAETILAKPLVYNSVLYVFTKNSEDKVRVWSCNINDENSSTQFVYTDALGGENGIGTVSGNSFGYIIDNVNGSDVIKAFNINGGKLRAVHYKIGDVENVTKYEVQDAEGSAEDYTNNSIRYIKKVGLTNNVHIIMLLKSGLMKVLDNGYSNNAIQIKTRRGLSCKAAIKYLEGRLDGENHNYPIIKLYNNDGKCRVLTSDEGQYNYGTLSTSGNAAVDTVAFTDKDELLLNFDNNYDINGYAEYGNKTIIFGWFNENGVVKPLIKEIDPKKEGYSVTEKTVEESEVIRPFHTGLEPDSGISIVKNVPFGSTKAVRVKVTPTISDEAKNNDDLYFRESENLSEDGKYTTGSILWNALNKSGIPYNTHVRTIGRVILDGYDIPIESVLITRPDESEEYGSVLLSFDKLFDITALDQKYLKLGNVLYPGILFKNNKGFLNDAMISNVYNVDSTFAYDDASNGQIFEDLSLSIKSAIILRDTDDPIMVVASNNGKISSINLNTGSYITGNGMRFGENAPSISSNGISYDWVKDGEIVCLIKSNSKSAFFVLYASGKIIEYAYSNQENGITVFTTNYVSESDGCNLDTACAVNGNTLVYYVNDGSKKLNLFDLDTKSTDVANLEDFISLPTANSLYIIVNGEFFFIHGTDLVKFNPTTGTYTTFASNLPSNSTVLCYDFNDRIYITNGTELKYVELSTRQLNTRNVAGIDTYNGFLVYYNHKLYTVNSSGHVCYIEDNDSVVVTETSYDIVANKQKQVYFDKNEVDIIYVTTTGVSKLNISDKNVITVSNGVSATVNTDCSIYYDGNKYRYINSAEKHSVSVSDVICKISDTVPSSNGEEFIGILNNIVYLRYNNMIYAKDPRKTLLNYINRLSTHKITLRTTNAKPVTAIGFVDNKNSIAICFGDGAIESVYLPEYNAIDGYYSSTYGDIIENYSRTIFEQTIITIEAKEGEETINKDATIPLSSVAKPNKLGYSFIGWANSASEEDMIPITQASASDRELHNGDTIYAVFKDNHEEYVDRCVTRIYAKAGEFFNTGVISVNQVKEDIYFQSSDKSIRWANDIGAFFEGHDERFTGKDTSKDGIYNGNVLASKLFINGAGSFNIGKYVFYINGYNPSDTTPQTTVHNGIVIYDSQNDEYSVMSKGTDKLHGTILSRIFPFCYYHEGYIYIFGGLERRDIHTADGNNFSRFHRTNKIERFDLRTGETVILSATYGPSDRHNDNDTNLVYAGDHELRYLVKDNNSLKGKIVISEYNEIYDYEFNLGKESAVSTLDKTGVNYISKLGNSYHLISEDNVIKLVNSAANKTYTLSAKAIDGFDITEPIKVHEHDEFLIRTSSEFIHLVFDEDEGFVELSKIKYGENSELNRLYFAPLEHCKYHISKLMGIGDDELLLDDAPVISSSMLNYTYAYGKMVFRDFKQIVEYNSERELVAKGTNKAIEFIDNTEFLFNIANGNLIIKKISASDDTSETSIKVNGTDIKTIVGKDDIITCFVFDNNKLNDIVSYSVDKNVATSRNFIGEYSTLSLFYYESITKKIFAYDKTDKKVLCFTGIDVNSLDAGLGVAISEVNVESDVKGFCSVDEKHIALFYVSNSDNHVTVITDTRSFDTVRGVIGNDSNTSSLRINIDLSDISEDQIRMTLINGTIVLICNENQYLFIDDSNNFEIVNNRYPETQIVYQIDNDGIRYISGTKRYKMSRLQKEYLAGTNIIPIKRTFSKLDNAYITQNDSKIFVYAESSIFSIDKKTKTTTSYLGIEQSLGRVSKIVGLAADNSSLYLFDGEVSRILKLDLSRKIISKEISMLNLSATSNVVSDTHDGTVYFANENSLYKIVNDEAIFIASGLTGHNITSLKYIEANNAIRYSAVNTNGDTVKLYSYNIADSSITEIGSFNTPIRAENRITDYANIGMRQYAANFALDKYGNFIIVGGNRTSVDYNPTHITTIDGTNFNNFVETAGTDTGKKMLALRTIVDDNHLYSLGIGNSNTINVVFSNRNENDLKGIAGFRVGSTSDNRRYFTYNNGLFCVENETTSFRILKYNDNNKEFIVYSTEYIEKTGTYVSSHAYSDGTMYAIYLTTDGGEIKLNVVCYNLNTKKLVSSITETVYTSINTNIGSTLKIIDNGSWNGKYFTTILGTGTGSDNILVTINVLKLSGIKVLGRTISPSGSINNCTSVYFNGKLYSFGSENNVYKSRLTGVELNNTEAINVTTAENGSIKTDRIASTSTAILSGSRMIVTGVYEPSEINTASKVFAVSNSEIKQKSLNNNRILVLPDNKVAIGNGANTNSETPTVYDIAKSPIKSLDFSDEISIRIYSGVNEDIIASYNPNNNDQYDCLVISREYGSAIKDLVKLNNNSYTVLHADTPRISTLVINNDGTLSFKRYDGVAFGEPIDTGTNIHTIQEADLTMLFDSEMDEYALRNASV